MSEDPFYLDALATDPLSFDTAPAEEALWRAIGDCVAEVRDNLAHIEIPVLFINGDRDVFAPAAEATSAAARMQRATAITIPGHHDIINDLSHRQVARKISAFVLEYSTAAAAEAG
jgi:pimeloyl-ACP methyl ester carboxylesterase